MSNELDTDTKIAFLLGQLPAEDTAAIEEAFLADEAVHEDLQAIESELFDDYAAGMLSSGRAELFEQRFLQSAEGQERLLFARALAESCRPAATESPSLLARLQAWLRERPWRLASAGLVAAACALLLLWRGGSPNSTITRAELVLHETGVRGQQAPVPELPGADIVTLLLRRSDGDPGFPRYRATLMGGGERTELSVEQEQKGLQVRLEANELAPAQYELELYGMDADGRVELIGYYVFTVLP